MLQLNECQVPPAENQKFDFGADGVLRQRPHQRPTAAANANRTSIDDRLCVAVPGRPPPDTMDIHSLVADPLFTDPTSGDFSLRPESPALKLLGFEPIPPIEAPTSSCRGAACLKAALTVG